MRKIYCVLIILPCFLFTSCIELYEEITLLGKGKGSVEIGFSLGSLTKVGSIAGRYLQRDLMLEITSMPELASSRLNGIEGISNIRYNQNITKGKLYIAFDFASSKALNQAYYRMFFREKRWYEPKPVKVNNCRMKRYNLSPVIKFFVGKNKSRINDLKFLNVITLRSEIRTPSPVKSVSNPNYSIMTGHRNIEMKIGLQEFLQNTPNTGIKVRY